MYGLLNIALTAASDFSMFLSFIHQTHLPTMSSLFINNAKLCNSCGHAIPVDRGSPVDAFILSRLTQISGRRGRDLSQPGSHLCRGSPVYRGSSLHTNRPLGSENLETHYLGFFKTVT